MNKMTISEAIGHYLQNLNDAPLTRKQYKTALRRFQDFLRDDSLDPDQASADAIKLPVARKFVNSLKDYSASTERVYTYALYGFLDELVADPEIDFFIDMYERL